MAPVYRECRAAGVGARRRIVSWRRDAVLRVGMHAPQVPGVIRPRCSAKLTPATRAREKACDILGGLLGR
jgi:hypothetical protein